MNSHELGARCPNHKVRLLNIGQPGIGQCPISGVKFAYTAEEGKTKRVVTLDGSIKEEQIYTVTGDERS